MPEPSFLSTDLWCLKGSSDVNDVKNVKDGTNHENPDQSLLHRMFEKLLVDAAKKSQKLVDTLHEGPEMPLRPGEFPSRPSLTEYTDGVDVDNMKTITYEELNEQSNCLARTLLRKLGKRILG